EAARPGWPVGGAGSPRPGNAEYPSDREALLALCRQRGVAVQTIKSVARRRWPEARQGEGQRRFSWYEPLTDPDAIARAVQFVFGRPGLFLNSSSDATLLPHILDAASRPARLPSSASLAEDVAHYSIEPLFVRDVAEGLCATSPTPSRPPFHP